MLLSSDCGTAVLFIFDDTIVRSRLSLKQVTTTIACGVGDGVGVEISDWSSFWLKEWVKKFCFLMEEQKQRKEMKKHRRAKKRCVLFCFVFSSKKFRNSNRNKMATGCKSGEEKSGFNLKDTDFEINV